MEVFMVETMDILARIESAPLETALKAALQDVVVQALGGDERGITGAGLPLQDALPVGQRRRLVYWLEKAVNEALEPPDDTHWWEMVLDFWNKAAERAGENGRAFLAASQRLAPLMARHLGPYDEVTLREINAATVWGVCILSDTLVEPQKFFVAPNAISLAQAHFNEYAWFRAIYAGKALVGFMMIVDDDQTPEYFLWRFMIGAPFQGRGYGAQAIQRLVEYVRTRPGAKELLVSCGQGEGSPEGFYMKQGFLHTGQVLEDEIVLRLTL
jgi:GNAT superfamily N-acetyltransferase